MEIFLGVIAAAEAQLGVFGFDLLVLAGVMVPSWIALEWFRRWMRAP